MDNNSKVFLSIVAPAYNEEENIEAVVRYWEQLLATEERRGEIVITNDGSQDNTKQILDRLQQEFPNLSVIHHEKNGGYGQALATAIKHSRGSYVLTTDSDGQFDVAEYKLLWQKLNEGDYDLVTGFRKKKSDSLPKVLADRVLNFLVRLLFGVKLRDTNCALKLFKGKLVRQLSIEAVSYPTPTELVIKANALGYRIGEVGITHLQRTAGESKLKTWHTGVNFFKFLCYLKLKLWLLRQKIIRIC